MEMEARGLEKLLNMEQRKLMGMLLGVCSGESQRSAAEALGLCCPYTQRKAESSRGSAPTQCPRSYIPVTIGAPSHIFSNCTRSTEHKVPTGTFLHRG
ncbi:hypothetical protein CRYUN_Cryun05aG0278300 [Craigia yunnanensis]